MGVGSYPPGYQITGVQRTKLTSKGSFSGDATLGSGVALAAVMHKLDNLRLVVYALPDNTEVPVLGWWATTSRLRRARRPTQVPGGAAMTKVYVVRGTDAACVPSLSLDGAVRASAEQQGVEFKHLYTIQYGPGEWEVYDERDDHRSVATITEDEL